MVCARQTLKCLRVKLELQQEFLLPYGELVNRWRERERERGGGKGGREREKKERKKECEASSIKPPHTNLKG